MLKFNAILPLLVITLASTGCWFEPSETDTIVEPPQMQFFHNDRNADGHFKLNSLHNLSLRKGPVKWDINESGFSPILDASFAMTNKHKGMWPKAWLAFNVHLFWKDKALAHIPRSGVMSDHKIAISFRQTLPEFGIKTQDLRIEIEPIAWMPALPLKIE